MTDRTITLRSDLVERLETLAEQQGRSLDDVFDSLLNSYVPASGGNWAISWTAASRRWRSGWASPGFAPSTAATSRSFAPIISSVSTFFRNAYPTIRHHILRNLSSGHVMNHSIRTETDRH
ncbi:MAG: hypothetical protein IPK19_25000 [Chloroflexi bacterium]|nr:hypothetical protein [Chloroflexota bacterium]